MEISEYSRRKYNLLKLRVEKRFIRGICKTIKKKWLIFWRKVDLKIAHIAWKSLTKKIPVVKNQIMFRTYQDNYTCNPKYLCEELLRQNADCKIIWVYSKKTPSLDEFPLNVELVKFGTLEYYIALCESKYWIDNAHNFTWEGFPKKPEQVLINLWHGSLGLKTIDPASDSNVNRQRAGKLAGLTTGYCITNSTFEEEVFRTSYWPNTPFLRFGHTRNDILFDKGEKQRELKEKVCEFYGISPDTKIFLYAPTFRDTNNIDCFNVDFTALKKALEERFGGKWVIFSRFHMHTQSLLKRVLRFPKFVISADKYPDIQELMVATDIGMTDYSSWICDFVLTGRPGFLFTTDYDDYVDERGFYYPLEETPFPIAKSNEQLIELVRGFDAEKYEQKRIEFLEKRGCTEDGHAAERLVEFILNDINNN